MLQRFKWKYTGNFLIVEITLPLKIKINKKTEITLYVNLF
jgi:hypothetical protein